MENQNPAAQQPDDGVDIPESTQDSDVGSDLREVISRLEGEIEPEGEPTEDETPEEAPEEVSAEGEETIAEPAEPAPPEEAPKFSAPIDWSPTLQEKWKEIPEEVQEAIHQREVAIATTMQNTANERRMAHSFIQAVEPFRGLMAAEGVQDPIAAVRGLMSTTAQLAMGTQAQKAKKISDLITHYGVDIQILDSVLAGEQPQERTEDERIQQIINQRLAPFDQMIQQQQRQQAQRDQYAQQQAHQTIEEFGSDPANEFFPHVRLAMADFLDVAAQNGISMSLKEAYDRACMTNQEIAQIISQRNLQSAAGAQQQAVAGKRQAASSIRGTTAGNAEPQSDGSIRSILEQQVPGASGRI